MLPASNVQMYSIFTGKLVVVEMTVSAPVQDVAVVEGVSID